MIAAVVKPRLRRSLLLFGVLMMGTFDIEMQRISLATMIIALGMLVDNAIVIIENVYRYMEQGVPRIQAAIKATSEVAYPVIGSTLTTLAAFLPLILICSPV